jgi:hypothetical protein
MNVHTNAGTPLCGHLINEMVAMDAAPLMSSSSNVPSLAAPAQRTVMAPMGAMGDAGVAAGLEVGIGAVASAFCQTDSRRLDAGVTGNDGSNQQ